jgi:hypothetical protein
LSGLTLKKRARTEEAPVRRLQKEEEEVPPPDHLADRGAATRLGEQGRGRRRWKGGTELHEQKNGPLESIYKEVTIIAKKGSYLADFLPSTGTVC